MEFLKNVRINIIGHRKLFYAISLTLVIISAIGLVLKGGPNFGVDFKGGLLLQIKTEPPAEIEKVRSVLGSAGYKAEVQTFGKRGEFILRFPSENTTAEAIKEVLETGLASTISIERTEMVGPSTGRDLTMQAITLVLISMLLMLVYIWFRFDLRFGAASVIALFHDAIIALGIYTMLGREFSVPIVAALLTLIGYSINDSIVVADRIREKLKNFGKAIPLGKIEEIFNSGVNETLSRTIITSLSTLIPLITILIFASGTTIFDFALILTIGIIVGTYSSIGIVASLVVDWYKRSTKREKA
ncbi:MAG: protein translocase subunit SecF [Candidatus Hydrothermia bacterium]|nr:protein translocase subunit SecF [Candidatus Hydrothermia bacterium]